MMPEPQLPIQPLRVALIAPPTIAVPADALGGLDQVRLLAEGLALRGHEVIVIGAGVPEDLDPGGYRLFDTDPTPDPRADPETVEGRHAIDAGKELGSFDLDVIGDHTTTGVVQVGDPLPSVQTNYQPVPSMWATLYPPHVAPVAVSLWQQRQMLSTAWRAMIHPAVPMADHPLSEAHDGPCVYLGPLQSGHGARAALDAAHQADAPIILAGTTSDPTATTYTELELVPHLGTDDELLGQVGPSEREELLARARCLVAPLDALTPYSLEIVQALAHGTPIAGLWRSVAAELVDVWAGMLVDDRGFLGPAIREAIRRDPNQVRATALRFDTAVMVDGYEALLAALADGEGR
jgi:hypothetical protein